MPPNILLQFMHILERPQASEDVEREILRNGKKVWAAVYQLYVYIIHAYIPALCLHDSYIPMLIPQKIICISLHIKGLFLNMYNET